MQFVTSILVGLMLALAVNAAVIPVITSAGLVQQTVDLNGVRGVLLSAGPSSANLVLASPSVVGGQALVVGNPWGPQTVVTSGALQLAPSVVQVAPSVVNLVTPEASYVAQNRGAVHVAPLPGHTQSASSVNLEPAPGTD